MKEATKTDKTKVEQHQPGSNGVVPGEELELRKFFLEASADHEGHAQCVMKAYPGRFHYAETHGWMQYNGRFWEKENAEAAVERAITAVLTKRRELAAGVGQEQETRSKRLIAQSWGERHNVTSTRDQLRKCKEIRITIGEFDQDKDKINCANSVVDLRTGELTAHAPDQRFTYCLPVAYDPEADPSAWVEFLKSAISNDEQVLAFLQMAVGYSLTGHISEEILFYVHGPARSGKGTFTETLLATLGHEPLATEADFETFTAKRYGDTQNFDLAPLKPCRFVAASESSRDNSLNAAKIKQLTGGNRIRCAFKRKDHFTYRPQFKIWLSSNHKANVDVDDDAAWGRLRVISFPNSHLGTEDKTLKTKMLAPANLAGVLAWAIAGSKLWYAAESGLKTPEAVTKETTQHRDQLDDVQLHMTDRAVIGEELFVVSSDYYQDYHNWCIENGFSPKHHRRFSMALDAKGFKLDRKMVAGRQQRVIVGLGLIGLASNASNPTTSAKDIRRN